MNDSKLFVQFDRLRSWRKRNAYYEGDETMYIPNESGCEMNGD